MAYSSLIDDHRFDNYVKNKKKWMIIFAVIIALAAIIGFYINGEMSSTMENPESLLIGLVIGSMFILIGFYSFVQIKLTKTWDGEVIKKENKLKKRNIGYDNKHSYQEYMEYKVIIRRENAKLYEIIACNDDTLYNYYHVGDKVRHHKKINSYEKYDKSKDSIVFCNACATLHDIKENTCQRCGCPLLK